MHLAPGLRYKLMAEKPVVPEKSRKVELQQGR